MFIRCLRHLSLTPSETERSLHRTDQLPRQELRERRLNGRMQMEGEAAHPECQ